MALPFVHFKGKSAVGLITLGQRVVVSDKKGLPLPFYLKFRS